MLFKFETDANAEIDLDTFLSSDSSRNQKEEINWTLFQFDGGSRQVTAPPRGEKKQLPEPSMAISIEKMIDRLKSVNEYLQTFIICLVSVNLRQLFTCCCSLWLHCDSGASSDSRLSTCEGAEDIFSPPPNDKLLARKFNSAVGGSVPQCHTAATSLKLWSGCWWETSSFSLLRSPQAGRREAEGCTVTA